jgi:DNA primase
MNGRKFGIPPSPFPISNPDKVYWPREGYTKGALARYYQSIFPQLSP